MNPLRLVIASLFLGTMVAPAVAQDTPQARRPETLVIDPPAGWHVASRNREPAMSVVHYVPAGEDVNNWTESIQAQVFYEMTHFTPEDFLANLRRLYADACQPLDASPVESRIARGYATAGQVLLCGQTGADQPRGEVAMFKVISGVKGLYVIVREWRGGPFDVATPPLDDDIMADWVSFFGTVQLCDDINPEAPCELTPAPTE